MTSDQREELDFMFDEELEMVEKKHNYSSHVDNWFAWAWTRGKSKSFFSLFFN